MTEMEEFRELKRMVADTMRLTVEVGKRLDKEVPTIWKAIEVLKDESVALREDIRATNANIVAIGESVKALQQTVEAYVKGVRNGGIN